MCSRKKYPLIISDERVSLRHLNLMTLALWRPFCYGAPVGIRTLDLLIRSQTLYPAELRALVYSRLEYITSENCESQLKCCKNTSAIPQRRRPAFAGLLCFLHVYHDQLDCEALCHLVVRIHEPLSLSAEVSSACDLRNDCVELADLRSDSSNGSDESCVDE